MTAEPSVKDYLSPFKSNKSRNFIPFQEYASFSGLQLIIEKEPFLANCTVSFTNQRLLITHKFDDQNLFWIEGWALDRKFIHAIKDCSGGLVLIEVNDPSLQQYQKECFFELKFPEEHFFELKQAFLKIQTILDLCQACVEDRFEDFQCLLENNPELVNIPIDSKMNSLLIMACTHRKYAVARYLLQFPGININKTTTVEVMRDGRKTEEIYGALYYACINNMGNVVESMLSIPTTDVNILYTNRYTALQYTILKDIKCRSDPQSSPNSGRRYAKIISMLMSHGKTIWKIAENQDFAIPADRVLRTSYETQKAILLCSRANELPVDLRQKIAASIEEGTIKGEIKRLIDKLSSNAPNDSLSDEGVQIMIEGLMNDSQLESTLDTLIDLSNRRLYLGVGLVTILCLLLHSGLSLSSNRKIITIFAKLSVLKENKFLLGEESVGLSALMFTFIHNTHVQEFVFTFFLNCVLEPINHEYYLSDKLGIAMYLREEMIRRPSFVFPYCFFANIAATGDKRAIVVLLKLKIHELFMNCLFFAGAKPAQSIDPSEGAAFRSLCSIFYLSAFSDEARYALLQIPGILEYFSALFQSSVREQTTLSSMILWNLLSVAPSSSVRGIFFHGILEVLVTIFYGAIYYDTYTEVCADIFNETNRLSSYLEKYRRLGFDYGLFKLRSVTASLRQLALQPKNRKIFLMHHDLMKLCKISLQCFIENVPEFHAIVDQKIRYGGGGGDDVETAECILEILLLLSFDETKVRIDSIDDDMVEKTSLWKKIYLDEDLELSELLSDISSVANLRRLSVKGIETVKLLLKRLFE
eukprot:gene1778-1897_t